MAAICFGDLLLNHFEVCFRIDPSAAGTRTAMVSIINDDSDENPYTFAICGTGEDASLPMMLSSFSTLLNAEGCFTHTSAFSYQKGGKAGS